VFISVVSAELVVGFICVCNTVSDVILKLR